MDRGGIIPVVGVALRLCLCWLELPSCMCRGGRGSLIIPRVVVVCLSSTAKLAVSQRRARLFSEGGLFCFVGLSAAKATNHVLCALL